MHFKPYGITALIFGLLIGGAVPVGVVMASVTIDLPQQGPADVTPPAMFTPQEFAAIVDARDYAGANDVLLASVTGSVGQNWLTELGGVDDRPESLRGAADPGPAGNSAGNSDALIAGAAAEAMIMPIYIPEPATLALVVMGAGSLLLLHRNRLTTYSQSREER